MVDGGCKAIDNCCSLRKGGREEAEGVETPVLYKYIVYCIQLEQFN